MNREIKFRAWDKTRKQMKLVDRVQYSSSKWFIEEVRVSDGSNLEYLKSGEVELMQYTGLNDENGKEIYEGDILRRQNKWGGRLNGHEYKIVRWNDEPSFLGWNIARGKGMNWEVVGNIYEHKHLLPNQHGQ